MGSAVDFSVQHHQCKSVYQARCVFVATVGLGLITYLAVNHPWYEPQCDSKSDRGGDPGQQRTIGI